MESSPDWTATALFSPSKARAQQAQAKDWASIDAWLARKYASKQVPAFERNEETLQALLSLATLNDSADEQRGLIEKVEKAALAPLQKRASDQSELLGLIVANLDKGETLDALARTAVALDLYDYSTSRMGEAIVDLTTEQFTAQQQVRKVEYQLTALRAEQARLSKILEELSSDEFKTDPDLPTRTSQWAKGTKQLKAKIAEYDDRLSAARSAQPSRQAFNTVIKHLKDLEAEETLIADLEAEKLTYRNLPSEVRAARAVLEKAEGDLHGLLLQRDSLFEGLVDG